MLWHVNGHRISCFHGNHFLTGRFIFLLYRLDGIRTRHRRLANAVGAHFKMPDVPSEPNPKATEIANRVKDGLVEVVQKLFINRPIWSRSALQSHVHTSAERLKQLLASVSYYWLNGPWRTLWTRIGYDPRKDPSSKM